MENRIEGTVTLNGREYIAKDKVIEDLVKAVLQYHFDGDLGVSEYETNALDFVAVLLHEGSKEYEVFCESYVHQKYPQMFQKES